MDFFSNSPNDLESYHFVKIESKKSHKVIEGVDLISEFAKKLYGSYKEYLDSTRPQDRPTGRKAIGTITIKKEDVTSCYTLFQSKEVFDLFAIRVNDTSKGGGSIFWFKDFTLSKEKVFK